MNLQPSDQNFETQLQDAKTDKRTLNILLHNYLPFIKKCVAGVFFKRQSQIDNLTDAMLAFTHSVHTYNPEQGAFIHYAAMVIRNRLIDNIRKEMLVQKRFFSFSSVFSSKKNENDMQWETEISLLSYDRSEEEKNLHLEIMDINDEFAKWGFSWITLLKKCPKQARSRSLAWRIAKTVLMNPALLADMLKTRQLPVTRLADFFSLKTLEKYRQYIAALIILSQGDYPYISSFVPYIFTEEENT